MFIFLTTTGALISNTHGLKELHVHLEPKYIIVSHNQLFFQPDEKYLSVIWYYSKTPDLGCGSDGIPKEQLFYTERNDNWAKLNIYLIKTNDSGCYFCLVKRFLFLNKDAVMEHKFR